MSLPRGLLCSSICDINTMAGASIAILDQEATLLRIEEK